MTSDVTSAGVRDRTPDAPPADGGATGRARWPERRDLRATAWLAASTVAGSLPILWVVGAVPWRLPTLLVEKMFRSFALCAMDGGSLTPLRMYCPTAGVPVGMYQTDGGLTYPLAGALFRAGTDAVVAWQLSVAVLVLGGTAVLCWLLSRLTRSPALAALLVVLHGLGGTASARSWDWYWRVTGAALLPLVLAAIYVLFVRAPRRRVRVMAAPLAALTAAVLVVSLEWQYAGLFAAASAVGATLFIVLQRGWRWRQRAVLLGATAVGLGAVSVMLRMRLSIAGIGVQMENALEIATGGAVDLAGFVVPDGPMSLLGRLLVRLGAEDHLARSLVEYRQLWVTPYVDLLVLAFLLALLVRHRFRVPSDPGRPPGFLPLLAVIAVASAVLAMGPVIRVAGLAEPSATVTSPVSLLYDGTPVQWIRFPRTWGYLLHLSLLLAYASLAAAFLRRVGRGWSPLVAVFAALLALELVSPQVLAAAGDPRPSIALAPEWNRLDSDDPPAVRFAAEQQPEYEDAVGGFDGPIVILPWRNAWSIVSMGPDVGIPVRNVGIDRNLVQVVEASPFRHDELEQPTTDTMRRMLDSRWASAVVLLDHFPHGTSIERYDSRRYSPADLARQAWRRRHQWHLARDGYCIDEHTWFTVVSPECAGDA